MVYNIYHGMAVDDVERSRAEQSRAEQSRVKNERNGTAADEKLASNTRFRLCPCFDRANNVARRPVGNADPLGVERPDLGGAALFERVADLCEGRIAELVPSQAQRLDPLVFPQPDDEGGPLICRHVQVRHVDLLGCEAFGNLLQGPGLRGGAKIEVLLYP